MRRSIPFVAAVVGLGLTLTACSGGTATDPTTTAAEPTASATAPGAGSTLTIWVDDTRGPAVQAAAEKFETDTGAKVELVQKNFDDIRADFLAQVPTGEGPDITVGAHDWLGEFVNGGVVAPVELGDVAADFNELALQVYTYNGQLYGLPYAIENIGLIRNTDLAPEAPATWDEAIAMGEEAGAKYPILIQSNGEAGDPYTHYALQTSFGAEVFARDADGFYTTELAMGGENGEAFAKWLAEQGDAGNLDINTTYDIVVEAFAKGESPFIIGGPWMVSAFEGMNLAVDPVPSAGGEPARPFMGAPGFYLSAKSENSILATQFLTNYMSTEEAQVALYDAGNRLPALTAAADAVVATDSIAAGFKAAANDALPAPSIAEMGSVWTYWGNTEASIVSGKAEPVEAWQKMISDIEGEIG